MISLLWQKIRQNWPKYSALLVITLLSLWAWGCPPQVASLVTEAKKVTRPELQIELDAIIATAEARMADLEKQEQLRQLIFQNALLLAQGSTLNPVGLLTAAFGIYGAGTAVKSTAKVIRDQKNKKTA